MAPAAGLRAFWDWDDLPGVPGKAVERNAGTSHTSTSSLVTVVFPNTPIR